MVAFSILTVLFAGLAVAGKSGPSRPSDTEIIGYKLVDEGEAALINELDTISRQTGSEQQGQLGQGYYLFDNRPSSATKWFCKVYGDTHALRSAYVVNVPEFGTNGARLWSNNEEIAKELKSMNPKYTMDNAIRKFTNPETGKVMLVLPPAMVEGEHHRLQVSADCRAPR